jgi:hypothetical protein
MWSTVQAAITGGWPTTIRLIVILTVIAVVITVLGPWVGAPISAVLQSFL